MELKELLDYQEKLESRVNAYWTYWSVAVFAIAGWRFADKSQLSAPQTLGVAVGVMVFFCANLGVLYPATKLVAAVRDEIRRKLQSSPDGVGPRLTQALSGDIGQTRLALTVSLHLAVDFCLLFVLLFTHK